VTSAVSTVLIFSALGCIAGRGPPGGEASGGLPATFNDTFEPHVEPIAVAPALLRGPFDVEGRRRSVGAPVENVSFPTIAPVRDLIGVSFYVDANHSVVDPELKRRNEQAVAPVRAYVAGIVGLADGWMRSSPARSAFAAEAVGRLRVWADADALLGDFNQQGSFERKWTLGSLALAYLKVREAPAVDRAALATVQVWLVKIAHEVMLDYEQPKKSSNRNNHAYWAGLAVAASGVAANDHQLFDWGISRGRLGLAQIGADGTLPLELARKSLALHYHVFALAPLILLAEIAVANGVPFYDENRGALRRLVDRVLVGMDHPETFETLVHAAQEFTVPPGAAHLAWAEAYEARFHDPRLAKWLPMSRPLVDVRLGGDQTLAFGPASSTQ
jgi:poly(beta-D-mannuronate) lyase